MRRALLWVIAVLALPVSLWAGIYGILAGRVTDKEGKPIPGATIRIEGTTLGGFARQDGRFSIVNIPAGTYTVVVRAVGYREVRLQVRISADQTTEIAVQLESEAVRVQEVTVEARAPLVEKYAIGTLRNVSSEEMRSIPRQTVQQVALLTPGVLAAGNGFIVRGSRAIETQIRLDGLDIADQFVGAFGNGGFRYFPTVTNLAVEEVQVLTGSFAAEYGNALGGVVNTVTKTGRTDRYEATLRFYTDNVGFLYGKANNGLRRLPREEYNYELAFGGPIPLLEGSTFYLSAQYLTNNFRNAGLDVKDPWGNSWGQLPQDRTWMRSMSARLKFALTKDISLLLGGMFGLTDYERPSIGWMYARDEGIVDGVSNGVQEYFAKRAVIDQYVANALARITHTLSQTTYYELTFSSTWNVNEVSRRYLAYEPGVGWKRGNFDRPDFFRGFDLWYPQDDYVVEGGALVSKARRGGVGDKVIDHYTLLTGQTISEDGYVVSVRPIRNPLTGYIEGGSNATSARNPYGLQGFFNGAGNERAFEFRKSHYFQLDGYITSRVEAGSVVHLLKAGFEARFLTLRRHYNSLPWDGNAFFDVYTDEWGGNIYAENQQVWDLTSKPYKPYTVAAYVQDQFTYRGMILNLGVRLDYFNPNAKYRTESQRFIPIQEQAFFAPAEAKLLLSPRISVNYPITERSTLSVAYGIFQQMPQPNFLYDALNTFRLRGNQILGNPNLGTQRSNQYQVSYAHALTEDFAVDVTAYYKDIYNQVGLRYVPTLPDPYSEYTVAEYGNVRGVELRLRRRPVDNFGFDINYTLSYARGTASGPTTQYWQTILAGEDPYTGTKTFPLTEYFLDYDRRHVINATLTFFLRKGEGPSIGGLRILENTTLNLTGVFATGTPYTRRDRQGNQVGEYNGARQPSDWSVDMRLQRAIPLADLFGEGFKNATLELYVDFFNLLNATHPVAVYERTGSPDYDGENLNRSIGDFSAVNWYEQADPNRPETLTPGQYDSFGRRLYSRDADLNRDGVVTQEEKYQSYLRWVRDTIARQVNYRLPRSVNVGFLLRF